MKKCEYAKYCGNCSLMDIDYSEQLQLKKNYVQDIFNNNNIDINIPTPIGMFFPYKYRNKVHLAIKKFKGKIIIGFYEEGSRRVVDIKSCLLHDTWLGKLIEIVRGFVTKYRIEPYDNDTRTGVIRYVVARVIDGNIMCTIVTTTKNFAGREYLYAKLSEAFKKVSLYVNVNSRSDKLVFDDKGFSFVKGEKYLQSNILGVKYQISPNSFLQVNLEICKAMYNRAMELLDINTCDNIVDMYSGIGITSILFAKKCNKVISIEYNKEATKNAEINKKLNNIANLDIYTGACGDVINNIDIGSYSKCFLDPARNGAEPETINAILNSNIDRIVYMSCDQTTLARDIRLLQKDFILKSVECFDMFPHTNHIESIALLVRK